jgi:hypothetical protein
MLRRTLLNSLLVSLAIAGIPVFFKAPQNRAFAFTTKFFCDTSGTFPITVAKTGQGKTVMLIRWRSTSVDGYPPLKRCQEVSQRFQSFYEQGRLKFITSGRFNGSNVICVATSSNSACRANDILFTLRPGRSPNDVLKAMFSLNMKASGGLITESSKPLYINIDQCLDEQECSATE